MAMMEQAVSIAKMAAKCSAPPMTISVFFGD